MQAATCRFINSRHVFYNSRSSLRAFSNSAVLLISVERLRRKFESKSVRFVVGRKPPSNRKSSRRRDRFKDNERIPLRGDAEHLRPFNTHFVNLPGNGSERSAEAHPTSTRSEANREKKTLSRDKKRTMGALDDLESRLHVDPIVTSAGVDEATLSKHFSEYKTSILSGRPFAGSEYLLKRINSAIEARDLEGLDSAMSTGLHRKILVESFTRKDVDDQQQVANLNFPTEWFPATRKLKRTFHLHVGPTNSGKTYHALKRLEEAGTGVYCGPLRLLAHEVYMRLNASGKRCNLITGDDRRTADDNPEAPMASCTIEMVPLNWKMDVAVIDEMQMIASPERGWAWTQAILGVQASEIHVCGEERAVPILKQLAALCGETTHVHHYERLSPLELMPKSLNGDLSKLEKGDCVVCFSVVTVHALRQTIEKTLNCRVAVIYGRLPPETRAQQARLFNDPDNNYDILVASDAVGMGLNLSIRRIIFHSAGKFLGGAVQNLKNHEIKQIAGRAGRFSTAEEDISKSAGNTASNESSIVTTKEISVEAPKKQLGLVTSLEEIDYKRVARGFNRPNEPILTAGIFPPASIVDAFSKLFPVDTPFSFILERINNASSLGQRFHMCISPANIGIAENIDTITDLTLTARQILINSPVDGRRGEVRLLRAFAERIAAGTPCTILDIPEVEVELLEDEFPITRDYLQQVEKLNKAIVTYIWLSWRFPHILCNRELALHVKDLSEQRIGETLAMLSLDYDAIKRRTEMIRRRTESRQKASAKQEGDDADGEPDFNVRKVTTFF